MTEKKASHRGSFGSTTAESRCGIDPSNMNQDEMRSHLDSLYEAYQPAVNSLDPELRMEAEDMLKAIAQCRERYVDATG